MYFLSVIYFDIFPILHPRGRGGGKVGRMTNAQKQGNMKFTMNKDKILGKITFKSLTLFSIIIQEYSSGFFW